LESIDDALALVDLRPVTVVSLWQSVFESIHCGAVDEVTVFHPSWWSPARVDVVTAAAQAVPGRAEVRPRSWLLSHAAQSEALIVEIAEQFVVITGAATVVETRRRDQSDVAAAVVRSVFAMGGLAETLVVDAPAAVRGAGPLAASIAKEMPSSCGMAVIVVDDIRFRSIAAELKPNIGRHDDATGLRKWQLASLVFLAALLVGVGASRHHGQPPADAHFPTTLAVEGHVAVEVPADWPMRRVIAGPGSARLQFTSPADPEVALHVTQSRVALPGLDATADFLKSAIDAEPAGVFVEFNPADRSGGRPVVTYREVRSSHDIRWTVWVDKAVRISVGCQSRNGREDAVGKHCELAVRSARTLD
jgi:type VII secretion-associated protein (TIGR03931 family)